MDAAQTIALPTSIVGVGSVSSPLRGQREASTGLHYAHVPYWRWNCDKERARSLASDESPDPGDWASNSIARLCIKFQKVQGV